MKHLSLIILFSFLFNYTSHCCSCFNERGFCQTFLEDKSNLKVVLGKVLSQYEHGSFVEVIERLHGDIAKDTIIVWGDPGNLCRGWAGNNGDTVLLAIRNCSLSGNQGTDGYEKPGDYELSICGTYKLEYKNNTLTGYYLNSVSSGEKETINYEDFVNEFQNCIFLSANTFESGLRIAPNPSSSVVHINSFMKIRELSIYDMIGNKVYFERLDDYQYTIDPLLIGLSNGAYLLVLDSFGNDRITKKIIFNIN